MAKRHNVYGQLLGTVENNIVPLKEQMGGVGDSGQGELPAAGVPDLEVMAEDCQMMGDALHRHADRLRAMAELQPNLNDSTAYEAMPGGY